ncbi:MAG: glycosyltransferase family 4 protein [Acidobacteria bacterium]|nr:glycosyltransferase family 4 protein [Acidobacteriota bacterium]
MKTKSHTQRVWFVSELYYPELTSTGYFLTNIAEGIADTFDVAVLCCQPSYLSRGIRAPAHEIHNGVDIHRCWTTTFDKNKLYFKVVNLFVASLSMFLRGLFLFRQGDTVLSVSNPPPLLPYLMLLACRIKGARFALRVEDVYPDVLTRVGLLKEDSAIARSMDLCCRLLYRNASQIVVLGRDVQSLVRSKLDTGKDRVVVATNWGDVQAILPQSAASNRLLPKLNISGRFVAQYCGNIGRTHGIEDITAAAALLKNDPEFQFLMIGWGAKKEWALREKADKQLDNLAILDPLPWQELCDGLNACDVAIISFSRGMSGISVPSRMYNIFAAGKPLIAVCDDDSELAQVVREEGIGWVIPPGRPDLIVHALQIARERSDQLRSMGKRARSCAESKYTLNHVLQSYRGIVARLS